ncbi:MAG TPA: PEP-CTERM sorting domain-containing protein [Bryobacteraceae bacterium]|nr:PEP-CTERM sorting domain-containing protein [Bryobacteraceae bacterium]
MKYRVLFRYIAPTLLWCAAAHAATISTFNFDNDALGTSTTFTDTDNGLSAIFSSSADPGGFVVYPSMFETLTGNVLGDPGPAGANNIALDINFSQDLSALTFDFATADFSTPSPLTLQAFENSTLVGSTTFPGQFLPGFNFPEGEIAFSGATFNNVVISTTAPDFAVDNIQAIAATTAPEPGTLGMMAAGVLLSGIGVLRRRRQQ